MKILILTEGGKNIGFGHLTRCLSLCEAFESRGHHPRLIVNGDITVADVLDGREFELQDWVDQIDSMLWRIEGADVAVVDSYLGSIDVYEKISRAVGISLFLDDTRRMAYPPGIVVNWSIRAPDMGYPPSSNVHYLLGPSYISLRKAFWKPAPGDVAPKVKSLMVSFGGDDSKNLTPAVLAFLTDHYPFLAKHVVVGGAFKNVDAIEMEKDELTYLYHSPNDSGMKAAMEKSDLAITSGGQTLYELARMGVPAVVTVVADNQRGNVKGWEKTGFIEYAGDWTDGNLLRHLGRKLSGMMDYQRRERAVEAGRRVVPRNGAEGIIDFIEGKLKEK